MDKDIYTDEVFSVLRKHLAINRDKMCIRDRVKAVHVARVLKGKREPDRA